MLGCEWPVNRCLSTAFSITFKMIVEESLRTVKVVLKTIVTDKLTKLVFYVVGTVAPDHLDGFTNATDDAAGVIGFADEDSV